jgi:hypothetical protein
LSSENIGLNIKINMEKKDKTKIIVMSQEDIDKYNSIIGYRLARKKRYGKSASQRKQEKNKEKE